MSIFSPHESTIVGIRNRLFQSLARSVPGAGSIRVWLHRKRGVKIGQRVFIGTDAILDTSHPKKIVIGDDVVIGMRTTLIAHFGNRGRAELYSQKPTLIIKDKVYIGPNVTILPGVTINEGAVIQAGAVIKRTVPPYTMMEGNPAKAVATVGVPLTQSTMMWEFYSKLRPIRKPADTRENTEG
jgi:acetyltransferase-like isoleucine patch superfamily enzyme